MHVLDSRQIARIAFITLAILLPLAPGTTALAAKEGNWYPNGYYLHGHTDIHFPVIAGTPYHQGASYSLTSNSSVWIGVYTDVSDYCPNGGWGSFGSDGWHWNWNKPNMYHEAKTGLMPSRTCVGHAYTANGGHNIHIDGGILDFNGYTAAH